MKALARVVLILGAIGVGALLFGAAPREVTLVYGLPAGEAPGHLAVDIRRGGDLVRHAEIRVPGGAREVRHPVRLPDGEYRVVVRAGPAVFERAVTVAEAGTIVLPLGR
ncbi:MAG TPA: hypothetical protein VIV59_08185 [Anaeromyxobacteraceae bacterium]